MDSEGYWEGWGFNDTFKVSLTGNAKDVSNAVRELKKTYPKNDIKKYTSRGMYIFVYDNEVPIVKKIAKMFSLKVSYDGGGTTSNEKLIYVLYDEKDEIDEFLNRYGKRNRGWWQSNLNRKDSELLLNELKRRNLLLGFLIFTGDSSNIKFAKGGTPPQQGVSIADANPYIATAKAVQGIAPESVSALDKKMASKINPDPNRPIFFSGGGGVPRKMELYDAVLYKGKQYDISTKNGVVGLKNLSQGAWGSDYPFIPLSEVDINEVTDMYGNDVEISEKYALGGAIKNREYYHILLAPNNKFQLAYLGVGDLAKNITKDSIVQRYNVLFDSKYEAERYFRNIYLKLKTKDKRNATLIDATTTPPTIVFANRGEITNSFDPIMQEIHELWLTLRQSEKYDLGGGVDIVAPFGTLVSKNKKQKLEYKKVGSNFEFMIYEGVNNPVSNYSRTSFKKSKNGSIIMNYEEFLKFIYLNGFVDDQEYASGGKVIASGSSKESLLKLIERYLYGSTITLVETENDKIYEVHNKKGKTPFYVEFKRGKYNFIQPTQFDKGGGVESIKVGDRVYGYFTYNYMGYQLVDSRMGGDLVYGEIKDIITENNQKKYIIKFENGETKKLSFGIFKEYLFVDKKFDNGGGVGQTDYSVAQTILNQLGGMKRLVIMTGAYNFVASPNAVSFRIKNRKINYIKITLNGNDLYDVKFSRIFNYQEKAVAELNDIYFDQLIPIFEQNTGMYLKMFKKGGMVNTQNRDMVISQLKTIHHHEQEMLNALKNSGEIDAWVLSKVSNASSDLSDITHYLQSKD